MTYYVREYEGLGEHGYRPVKGSDKEFSEPMQALLYVMATYGVGFTNQFFEELTAGPSLGSIAWLTDNHGVGITLLREDEDI